MKKKNFFTLGHGSSNQIIIICFWLWRSESSKKMKKKNSLNHDMMKVVKDVNLVEK